MELKDYLKNPCKMSSLPYHKLKRMSIPENLIIAHESCFAYRESEHERYFRLYHNLKNIDESKDFRLKTASLEDMDTIKSVINASYDDIKVTKEQLFSYRSEAVFREELWVLGYENNTCLGCGIAEYDEEAGELVLEWIQVLPTHRRRGVGRAIVNELLRRAVGYASFATVSGKEEGAEKLYRACGFTGSDVWCIMKKK